MQAIEANVLYSPTNAELRFLPEGPWDLGGGRVSWVAIQHGADSTSGSLNLLDVESGVNTCCPLPGRPGFAIPTTRANTFVIGLERRIVLFDIESGGTETLCENIDADVTGTIVNDGLAFDDGLIFGTKDLEFREKKASLNLWRRRDGRLIPLRTDQICSNGKVLLQRDGGWELLDVDTPTRQVVGYELDVEAGRLGTPRVIVDLSDDPAFPDGMVLAPDGQSVIVAFYDPNATSFGVARQYDVSSGEVQAVWKTPGSPQVTCPLLLEMGGAVRLILTTAVEHMTDERQAACPRAGDLFVAATPFKELGDARVRPWKL